MNDSPSVSVVLPTWNRARLVGRAIRSVLNQDFGDFELIVVDDGSTDDTPAAVAAITDARLRYLRLDQNRGVGAARQEGISHANGELIGMMDADDVWLPGKLAYQVGLFGRYPQLDVVFGDYWNINHLTRVSASGFQQNRAGLLQLQTRLLEPGLWQITNGMPQAMLYGNFIALPSVAIRAGALHEIGGFNLCLKGAEDLELWWRAAVRGKTFAYTTRVLIERHKDSGSITAAPIAFLPKLLEVLDVCETTAKTVGRLDLIRHLNAERHRAWRRLILERAPLGGRAVWSAFRHSLHYGASVRAMAYLIAALGGPEMISALRRFKKLLTPPRVV